MSAYMTTPETRSVIAQSIWYYSDVHGIKWALEGFQARKNKSYTENGLIEHAWFSPKNDREALTGRLYWLLTKVNAISLGERYDEDNPKEIMENEPEVDEEAPIATLAALIELIKNWSYQSCEGVARETDFYKLMEKLKGELALLAVERERDWKIKHWGIRRYEELGNEIVPNVGGLKFSKPIK